MKLVKILLALVGVVVVLLVAALLAHPLWLGSVVSKVVPAVGPRYTGTPIQLGSADINLYKGHVALGKFALDNPKGCKEQTAVRFDSLTVDVDVGTVVSNVIVVREIKLDGLFASYVKAEPEHYNFDVIARNVSAATSNANEKAEAPVEQKTAETEESGKKVVIEKLTISNVSVLLPFLPTALPIPGSIAMTDIGKESQGVSWRGAWDEILKQLEKAVASAGVGIKDLGALGIDLGADGLNLTQEQMNRALEAAKDLDIEKAKSLLKNGGKGLKAFGVGVRGLFGN